VSKISLTDSANKAKYFFDCSPTIRLLEKCQLYSPLKAFSKIYTISAPIRVMEEYSIGDGKNPKPSLELFKQIFNPITVRADEDLLPYFFNESTSGEFWVISYVRQHPDFTCVIDEAFGRSVCETLGVKVTGTIGIIKEMKIQNLLTLAELQFARLAIKKSRFYLSTELLHELDEICDHL
jgi:predicted nucleic acid-binding protein